VNDLSLSTAVLPETEEEYRDFIRQFKECTLPKSRWQHAAHLLVALWYADEHKDEALPMVRLAILKYNESTGVRNTASEGYHETVTVFWMRIIHVFLRDRGNGRLRHKIAAELIAEYSFRKQLYREYYSFDLMKSTEARQRWVSPDLRRLPH
jgi:hypothetical protein